MMKKRMGTLAPETAQKDKKVSSGRKTRRCARIVDFDTPPGKRFLVETDYLTISFAVRLAARTRITPYGTCRVMVASADKVE